MLRQGEKIQFTASDPWDFLNEAGSSAFPGEVFKARTAPEALVVRFDTPLRYKDSEAEYAVIHPRHVGRSLDEIGKGEDVSCNLIGISQEQAESEDPYDTSWWRGGGIASIGSIRKASLFRSE